MIRVFGWQTSTAAEHDFRIGLPFPLLDPNRFQAEWGDPTRTDPYKVDLFNDYDVVFAHRFAGRSDLWLKLCAEPGVLCVYDMDDDLLCVDPENTVPHRLFAPLAQWTQENVLAADVVTVSSPALAERYGKLHPRVAVLPQVIPDGMPDWPIPASTGPLTIGWAGSLHKRQDWPGIAEQLAQVARLAPDVRFRMYGADYTRGLLGDRVEVIPFDPNPMNYWRGLSFDIGIAPLVDTPFNRGKTVTKLIEYGARGIPTVASAVGQYADWIDHGRNGFLVRDMADWVPYLLALTDDATRTAMAEQAHESSRGWQVGRQVHLWEAVFEGRLP